jgi:hypothetical protein
MNITDLGKFEAQSIPMIAVGKCPNSNGLQFYNPANGTFVSSIDYKFQSVVTSGVYFGLYIVWMNPPLSLLQNFLWIFQFMSIHSPPSVAKIVGIPSYDNPHVYIVAFKDSLFLSIWKMF